MANIDFSLLDVPRSVRIEDPEAYLHAAMSWHFGEDTGSPFWLRIARRLDFNPVTDVRTFTDLRLFPNLVNELRDVPVEDLIPRGYGSPPPLPQIFESGGTTGAPKRTAQLPDWIAQVVQWQTEDFASGGFVPGEGFLCLMPSGPHGVGYFSRLVFENRMRECFGWSQTHGAIHVRQVVAIELIELGTVVRAVLGSVPPAPIAAARFCGSARGPCPADSPCRHRSARRHPAPPPARAAASPYSSAAP